MAMDKSFIIQSIVKEENILGNEPVDEAYNLLQNGILVETSKGLVCMSLNDAISSDLNLSVDDLKSVATKLILQQDIPKSKEKVYLKTSKLNFDSDGFSSECSDVSLASGTSLQSSFITFASLSSEIQVKTEPSTSISDAKCVQLLPCTIDVRNIANIARNTGFDSGTTYNNSSSVSDSDTSVIIKPHENSESVLINETQIPCSTTASELHKLPKRRGGWPKGRKRKPELLNLPPKAPATGYNLFLNEQRKLFKDSKLVFHEITKLIGNKWSNLSLEEKRPYLDRADEDKKRYREELKQYRQSDAYRAYLAKKRKNRLQNNVLSESDMDATDEIDDEDNEELYCRTCDQWFHNLHNKREHLQGKQHTQTIAGEIKRELDICNPTPNSMSTHNEPAFDTVNMGTIFKIDTKWNTANNNSNSVADCMANLFATVGKREEEIKILKDNLQKSFAINNVLSQQLNNLRQQYVKMKNVFSNLKERERDMEGKVAHLWQVPSWFIITDLNPEVL